MKLQKARKVHACDLCKKEIPTGDKYWRGYHGAESIGNDRKEHTNCELYAKNDK